MEAKAVELKKKEVSPVEKIFTGAIILVIFGSSMCLVLQTEPTIGEKFKHQLVLVEAIASVVFLVEYLLRIWKSPDNTPGLDPWKARIRYALSFMGLIDLFSFLPSFVVFFGTSQTPQLMLLQLLRLIKLTRYSMAFDLLADVLKDEKDSLLVSIMLMFIVLIFSSVGIYIFESDVQPGAFGSIPKAMWWAIVTLTTVGYGDVTPITAPGRVFATFITIAGVGLVSLPAGIIASGFTEQLRLRRERFQFEVEQMIDEEGQLTSEDLGQLEEDRKKLGLTEDNARLIINQVKQREQLMQRELRKR